MKCGEIDLEAIPATDEEEEEVDWTAMCELEAAEALAGMARRRSLPLGFPSQDRANVTQRLHDYVSTTATTITIPERNENFVEEIPSTSCQLNSVVKSRPKLTQAEKEERKIRRILANREAARQTIRRRKAMHLELTRKAADVMEENGILKKEKEVAVDKYNSLKGRNEFLKAKLAEVKQIVRGMQDNPTTSSSEHTCPTKTPFTMHNQPSTVPCTWPVYQFQCAPGLGSNLMSSWSHFPMPYPCMMPCSHQVQESSMKTNGQGPQVLVVAVPWLFPCLAHGTPSDFKSGSDTTKNPHSSLPRRDNYSHFPSNRNMDPGGTTISSRPVEIFRPSGNAHADDSFGARAGSAPESIRHDSFHKNREPLKNHEDAVAATLARRRRKELMSMKTSHRYFDNLRYPDPG